MSNTKIPFAHPLHIPPAPPPPPARAPRGDWIQTRTGRQVYPLDLRPEDVDVLDIAWALSHQCRFAGHVARFYSVAEHSVRVACHLEDQGHPAPVCLWGLLHDASEAYLTDIPRPLKRHPAMAWYREAEARAMAVICERFGLPAEEPPEVKRADTALLVTEARDLMAPLHPEWEHRPENGYEVLEETIAPLGHAFVHLLFMQCFERLTGKVNPALLASTVGRGR